MSRYFLLFFEESALVFTFLHLAVQRIPFSQASIKTAFM